MSHLNGIAEIRNLVACLVSKDNEQRTAAETTLSQVYLAQQPGNTLLALVELLKVETDNILKSLLAVLIRRSSVQTQKVDNADPICRLLLISQDQRNGLCAGLLQCIASETNSSVRNQICDCIAEISTFLFSNDLEYPNIRNLVFQSLESQNPDLELISHRILNSCPQIFFHGSRVQHDLIYRAFKNSFEPQADIKVRIAALNSAVSIISQVLHAESPVGHYMMFGELVLKMINVLPPLLENQKYLEEALTIIVDLALMLPNLFKDTANMLFKFCAQIVANTSNESTLRQAALEFILTLIESAVNMMKKRVPDMESTLIPLCLQMMSELDDENTLEWTQVEDPSEDYNESNENYVVGDQAMDRLSRKLGGKVFILEAFKYIPSMLHSSDWRQCYAGLQAITAIAEGCASVMHQELANIINTVVSVSQHKHPRVRYAVCNCLAQLCTDFHPQVQTLYHDILIKVLMALMSDRSCSRVQCHGAAAVINFCDQIRVSALEPHLVDLVSMLCLLCEHEKLYVKTQAISTLAVLAETADSLFAPFVNQVFPIVANVLNQRNEPKLYELRARAVECLTLIATTVDRKEMSNNIHGLVEILKLVQSQVVDEDDMQKTFLMSAWSRICEISPESFTPHIDFVMVPLLKSAKLKPKVAVLDPDDSADDYPEEKGWTHDDIGGNRVCIKDSELEEKELALELISCYAQNMKALFINYCLPVLEIIIPLFEFDLCEDIRESSAEIAPLILDCAINAGNHEIARIVFESTFGTIYRILETEDDAIVISALVKCLHTCIETTAMFIDQKHIENLLNRVAFILVWYSNIIQNRCSNLNEDNNESYEIDAEDQVPIEALKVCQSLLKLYKGSLVQQLDPIINIINRFSDSARLKFLSIVFYSDIVVYGAEAANPFLNGICQLFMSSLSIADSGILQSAAYGLGSLAKIHGIIPTGAMNAAKAIYNAIDLCRSSELSCEPCVIENCVSAIGKIAFYCKEIQNNDLLRFFLSEQPILEDNAEAIESAQIICSLLESKSQLVRDSISNIVSAFSSWAIESTLDAVMSEKINSYLKLFANPQCDWAHTAIKNLPDSTKHALVKRGLL